MRKQKHSNTFEACKNFSTQNWLNKERNKHRNTTWTIKVIEIYNLFRFFLCLEQIFLSVFVYDEKLKFKWPFQNMFLFCVFLLYLRLCCCFVIESNETISGTKTINIDYLAIVFNKIPISIQIYIQIKYKMYTQIHRQYILIQHSTLLFIVIRIVSIESSPEWHCSRRLSAN